MKKNKKITFNKTSVMHKDIGVHEHKVIIFDSYEIYAVCKLCGMHDWSLPDRDEIYDFSAKEIIDYFKEKYPKHEVSDINDYDDQ